MPYVLIIRSEPQASELAALLRTTGINSLLCPVLQVVPLPSEAWWPAFSTPAQSGDYVICVSPMVAKAWQPLTADQRNQLKECSLFAVGPGTAEALSEIGFDRVSFPVKHAGSEALMALGEIQLLSKNDRVFIFKGQGGQDRIGKALRDRGICVQEVLCYARTAITKLPTSVWHQLQGENPAAIICGSLETLRLFWSLLTPAAQLNLQGVSIPVFSQRMLEFSGSLGLWRCVRLVSPAHREILNWLREAHDILCTTPSIPHT